VCLCSSQSAAWHSLEQYLHGTPALPHNLSISNVWRWRCAVRTITELCVHAQPPLSCSCIDSTAATCAARPLAHLTLLLCRRWVPAQASCCPSGSPHTRRTGPAPA
jgi:hypothetical protein